MENRYNNRVRTMAALAVQRDGESAMAIAEYMSEGDRAVFEPLSADFLNEAGREFAMEQKIRHMSAAEKFSSLAEVHPAWVLERLKEEPPKVIGIILRYLPSGNVRHIIKNLPPMVRVQIPNMLESFAVSAPVLDIIRSRFERRFLPMPASRTVGKFGFSELYYLKGEELSELIRELGLNELAVALAGMGSKAMRAIYNRMALKDAKRLQRRIRELKGISPELGRQARHALLKVQGRHIGPDSLIARAGLSALANAVGGEENLIPVLTQKLSPENGYMLKRFAGERRTRRAEAVTYERQSIILSLVASLAGEARINPSWSSFDPEESAPIPVAGAVSDSFEGEETITSQQLA